MGSTREVDRGGKTVWVAATETPTKKGDRIVWKNKDLVPHTATAAGSFDSKSIASGASWSHVVRKPGRYDVVCLFHPGMKATLVVQ